MCRSKAEGGWRCAAHLPKRITRYGPTDAAWITDPDRRAMNEPNKVIAVYGKQSAGAALNIGLRIMSVEHGITKDIKEITPTGWRDAKLDERVKAPESIARKVDKALVLRQVPVKVSAAKFYDALRYTLVAPGADDFAYAVQASLADLVSRDYGLVEMSDRFLPHNSYMAFHSIASDHGIVTVSFEIQFHTEESFAIKMQTDPWYHHARVVGANADTVAAITEKSRKLSSTIEIPKGLDNIEVEDKKPIKKKMG